jgi:hypothetical protein
MRAGVTADVEMFGELSKSGPLGRHSFVDTAVTLQVPTATYAPRGSAAPRERSGSPLRRIGAIRFRRRGATNR